MGMFDFSPDDRPFWIAVFSLFGTGGLGYYIRLIQEKLNRKKHQPKYDNDDFTSKK